MTATATPARDLPVPVLPDPEVVTQAMTRLAEVAAAAARTTAVRTMDTGALPYDPTTLASAVVQFNTAVLTNPATLFQAQARNWSDWTALWTTTAQRAWGLTPDPVAAPARGDRRFSAEGWSEPAYDALKQAYLLAGRQLQDFIATAPVDETVRAQVDFLARQLTNALSPSNFAHTNPEAARRAVETGGMSLITGLTHLLEDVARGDGLVGWGVATEVRTHGATRFADADKPLVQSLRFAEPKEKENEHHRDTEGTEKAKKEGTTDKHR